MQELGVWSTASGTSEAFLEFDSNDNDIDVTELPSWATGAIKGAVAGAATGAAGGPVGALIGAATGGALGAASSAAPSSAPPASGAAQASAPKSTAPNAGAPQTDQTRARVVHALQQFAAIVPVLVQFVTASGQSGKEFGSGEVEETQESIDGSDWGPESFQGTWTLP